MHARVSREFSFDWWPAAVTLVSSGVEEPNIFTVGVLGAPCSRPPMVTISPRDHIRSYELIKEHGQFVVNFPTVDQIDSMFFCGTHSGRDVDKWAACNFTPIRGEIVDVPLIAECPVNLECTVEQEIRFELEDGTQGTEVLIIGRIVRLSSHETYVVDGKVQWDLIDLIFRSRPRTWRALGAVVGYDPRKSRPDDPRLAPERVNARTARLAEGLGPEA
jgi:flavin reductase (DIM6/NTAB) family NADH-FMN oxidoreductase RutF